MIYRECERIVSVGCIIGRRCFLFIYLEDYQGLIDIANFWIGFRVLDKFRTGASFFIFDRASPGS